MWTGKSPVARTVIGDALARAATTLIVTAWLLRRADFLIFSLAFVPENWTKKEILQIRLAVQTSASGGILKPTKLTIVR